MQAPKGALRLLGDFSLVLDGRTIVGREWPRRRAAAILKLLGLAPDRSLHREQLMELLWPDLDPASAANQLYKSLHLLRRAAQDHGVSEAMVSVSGGTVRLATGITCDVTDFRQLAWAALADPRDERRLRAALAAYGGDLLPDDVLEEWTDAPREELRALHRNLLLAESDALAGRGDVRRAVVLLERILAHEPWLEEAHLRLIRLHLAAGRQAEALRQYHACREALHRELGVTPGPAVEAAVREALDRPEGPAPAGPERRALLEQLGDVERRTGDVRRSATLYQEALQLAEGRGDADAVLRLRGKAALNHILDGDLSSAGLMLDGIRRELREQAPAYVTARTYYLLAQLRWHSGRFRDALDGAQASLAAARQSGDREQRARALEILALACHALGDWKRGLEAELERQALGGEAAVEVAEALEGHACLWEYHLHGDREYPAVEQSARTLLARAEALGNRRASALCLLALGSVQYLTGDWDPAADALRRSASLATAIGAEQVSVHAAQRLGLLEAARGNLREAIDGLRRVLERAAASSSAQVLSHSRTRILASLARAQLQAGLVDDALASIDHAGLVQQQVGECVTCDALLHPTAVPVLLAVGDRRRAMAAVRRATSTAGAFGGRGWAAAARHAGGLLAAAAGDPEARPRLAAAARDFRRLGQPYDEARSLEALAAVLRRGGARAQARDAAARATALYRRAGAAPNADRLDLLLEARKVQGRRRS